MISCVAGATLLTRLIACTASSDEVDRMYAGPGNDACLARFDGDSADVIGGGDGRDTSNSNPGDESVHLEFGRSVLRRKGLLKNLVPSSVP
jgi:hypothetical protein